MDVGAGRESFGVQVGTPVSEYARGTTHWLVEKFDEDMARYAKQSVWYRPGQELTTEVFRRLGIRPYETGEHYGNIITTAGWTRVANLMGGLGGTAFNSTNARIGVGNGSTAVAVGNTDLSAAAGSTNRWFQLVSGAPTVTSPGDSGATTKIAYTASFASADGNFAWSEFGVDNGTASGNTVTAPLFNRALISQGTKIAGQVWNATATINFT